MTQDQWIALAFKVVLISGFVALTAWVAVYIRLTRGAALKDPIGQTLIAKSLLLAAVLVPSTLSLFFTFSRWTSHLAGWVDVVLIGAITPVMWWRTAVWIKVHRSMRAAAQSESKGQPRDIRLAASGCQAHLVRPGLRVCPFRFRCAFSVPAACPVSPVDEGEQEPGAEEVGGEDGSSGEGMRRHGETDPIG